ncbi:MAG: ATP-binding protein [Myxococcota bacterium]
MIVVELALKDVRGFESSSRLQLKPGLNVLRIQDGAARSALLDAVYFPLFPDPARAAATAPLAQTPSATVILTFYGRDKKAYRLRRNLETGATKLYTYAAQAKRYQLLTEVTQEAAQFVRVQQRLPDEVSYERLFLLDAHSMPSRGHEARTRSGTPVIGAGGSHWAAEPSSYGIPFQSTPFPGPAGPTPALGTPHVLGGGRTPPGRAVSGFGSSDNVNNALVRSELEGEAPPTPPQGKRRKALLEERAQVEEHLRITLAAERAQDELDTLTRRRVELEDRAAELRQAEARRHALEEELRMHEDVAAFPEGMRERLADLDAADERYRAERAKLDIERVSTQELRNAMPPSSLLVDPLFVGGAAFLVLTLVVSLVSGTPWIALLNILGAIAMAVAAFRSVSARERYMKFELRAKAVDERIQRLEKQFELDTSVVRKLMAKFETDDPSDLLEQLEAYDAVNQKLSAARLEEDSLRTDREVLQASTELSRIEPRIKALEADVFKNTGTVTSSASLRQRLVAIDHELKRMSRASKAAPVRPNTPVIRGSEDIPALRRVSSDITEDDLDAEDGYGGRGNGGGNHSGSGPLLCMASGGFDGGYGGGMGIQAGYGGGGGGNGQAMLEPDRSRELMQAGIDLMQTTLETFTPDFQRRFNQFLSALTDQRYVDSEFGPRGEVRVMDRDQKVTPYAKLQGEILDLVDVAIRFSLAEAVVSRVRIPVVVDDPFEAFPKRRRKLFVQMLQYMSKLTQVIVLTRTEDITEGHQIHLH